MKTQLAPPRLGTQVLLVLDPNPQTFEALRSVTANFPNIEQTYFTLLCCCPTHYWEHGGCGPAEAQAEVETALHDGQRPFTRREQGIRRVRDILEGNGALPSHILVSHPTADSLIDATMAELRRGRFTGVIVSHYHDDIISRLERRGVTDILRRVPPVAVLVTH